jgi:hypothetical protein
MTLLKQLPKEQQAKLCEMANDLIGLDDRMIESLKRIQKKYEWHRDFVKEFLKGNRTLDQFLAVTQKDLESNKL